ncbi:MAG: hypothetical protein WCW65_00900 [Candidatus Paceibacterota bacterium]
MKEKLDEIYTDFQAQQVAQENPNSFWSKFFVEPLEKLVIKIKKKKKLYTISEKRILVEKRKQKREASLAKGKQKTKKNQKLKKLK